MKRDILLLEPNYRNKYPPMGLMKIATYYRQRGDNVRFFKGDLRIFAANLLFEEFSHDRDVDSGGGGQAVFHFVDYLRTGKLMFLRKLLEIFGCESEKIFREYRSRFLRDDVPFFDAIAITTLFTFYWKQTIETINDSKKFLKPGGKIFVGGVAATLVPEYIEKETGIRPHIGLLDKPGDLDEGDPTIIDELPLDYSILEEIDYEYPARDAYFAYTTRGCIRRCEFCAVKTLEPEFKNYVGIRKNIEEIDKNFGAKTDLLLLDNNVLASPEFERIIDEIKSCGFERGASYTPPDEYEIAIENLKRDLNPRAYIRKILKLYDRITRRLTKSSAQSFLEERDSRNLLYLETATKDQILKLDPLARSLWKKYFKRIPRQRHVDFNQGIDARLVTPENMRKLAEINIQPLRIAFDHLEQKEIYIRAIRLASENGIRNLSNYILYNFLDRPEDFYERVRINVELCAELNVQIYSFPMKYQPIFDPKFFRSRDYIGKHWNRKFIRAIQSILNSTAGKIGRSLEFFEVAFGKNLEEFQKILWMPEQFIINRMKSRELSREWELEFESVTPEIKKIISENRFTDDLSKEFPILRFYLTKRSID